MYASETRSRFLDSLLIQRRRDIGQELPDGGQAQEAPSDQSERSTTNPPDRSGAMPAAGLDRTPGRRSVTARQGLCWLQRWSGKMGKGGKHYPRNIILRAPSSSSRKT